jgi:group I intron endonuclease
MIFSIYKITNQINQKLYIGYTENTTKRWRDHKSSKDQIHLHRAMRKYGTNAFSFEIIYQSQDKKYTLEIMEPYFIAEYDTYKNGYNGTTGGSGGDTSESINYQKSMKLRNFSGVNNPNYGNRWTKTDAQNNDMIQRLQKPISVDGVIYKSKKEAVEKSSYKHYQISACIKDGSTTIFYL